MKVQFLGNSAFRLISDRGVNILIDPYLKGKIDQLSQADLILVTHGAFDHFGDTVDIVKQTNAKVICDPSLRVRLTEEFHIDGNRIGILVWGGVREELGIKIRAVENRHISFYRSGNQYLTGMPLSFVIYMEEGIRIFHPGDTSIFSDLQLIGRLYRPDIAFVPVGAVSKGRLTEMTPPEVVEAVMLLRPDLVIPMHYEAGDESPNKVKEILNLMVPDIKVVIMEPGATLAYEKTCSVIYPLK